MLEQIVKFFQANPSKFVLSITENLKTMSKIDYWRTGIMCDGIAKLSIRNDGTQFLARFNKMNKCVSLIESNEYGAITTLMPSKGEKLISVVTKDIPEAMDITRFPKTSQKEIIDSIRSHSKKIAKPVQSQVMHNNIGSIRDSWNINSMGW